MNETTTTVPPTHRCKVCGALWTRIPGDPAAYPAGHPCHAGWWNLMSPRAGPCCDNAPMGEQIEALPPQDASPAAHSPEELPPIPVPPGDRYVMVRREEYNGLRAQLVILRMEMGEAVELVDSLRSALRDAINSPKGVVPDSALPYYNPAALSAAKDQQQEQR